MTVGTYQNVNGAVPVNAVSPPPEGNMAASATFTLTPAQSFFAYTYQLNNMSGGLGLSQVVTICIDNTRNAYPLTVTHGALNEVYSVAAGAFAVVPTFSNKAVYSIEVAAGSPGQSIALSINMVVNIVFLNYNRASGTFPSATQPNTIATGQNSTMLYSSVLSITTNAAQFILGVGNYIFDWLEFSVEFMSATSGGSGASLEFLAETAGMPPIFSCYVGGYFADTNPVAGPLISSPIRAIWPNGLLLPRAASFTLFPGNLSNVGRCEVRLNISGYSTP